MRRGIAVLATVVVILTGVGIGVAAYQAGERNGIGQGIEQVEAAQANGTDVVYVDNDRPFFFPGFFLFPLFLFGTFFLIGAILRPWSRHGHGHGPWGNGPGGWNEESRRRFEERAREWHSKEHGQAPPAPAV